MAAKAGGRHTFLTADLEYQQVLWLMYIADYCSASCRIQAGSCLSLSAQQYKTVLGPKLLHGQGQL